MNLVLDIGNTQYKISVFDQNKQVFHEYCQAIDASYFSHLFKQFDLKKGIFSDTRGIKYEQLVTMLPSGFKLNQLTPNTPLPIQISYETPNTLGKDRIAAAVGAVSIFPENHVLIIDIGTAITIDFVNINHEFKGGIISPGQELRFRALHSFTGKLPLCSATNESHLTGYSTQTAIQFGVMNSIEFEINEYIARYNKIYPDLKVILTGGDAYLFEKKIKYRIFAEPFLVPVGLNSIILYNE